MSKSEHKRLTAMGLYEKANEAQKELRDWQLLVINLVSGGLTVDEDTIREYRRAVTVHNRYMRLIAGDMCK